tara:strand:- start:141 stop:1172 length:1032 start_codon:yes stop_codon:yes gene_type:complete
MTYKNILENNGLSGLANLGNTCYINSCMQVLSHCDELNKVLNKYNIKNIYNNDENSTLFLEWKDLNDLLWAKNCCIAPKRFINTIQNVSREKNMELFSGFLQNDVPEFLFFIIDCFHNALKREVKINILGKSKNNTDDLAKLCFKMLKNLYSNDYSEILQLFYGINVSLIVSLDNKTLSSKPEPYCIISLPIPKSLECSIYDCFNLYSSEEYLTGDNCWFNEKTNNKEEVKKSIKFWNFPEILILNLNRFNNNNQKINTLVNLDINNLDLSKYVLGYNKESFIYEVFGICNHSGNCFGGHYYSYIKNNNKWFIFNDTNVSEISENKLITNKAYMFFFKKIKKL